MIYTYEYTNDIERDSILTSNLDKYLIEERNIKEGNFLVFTTIKPIEIEMEELKQILADLTEVVLMQGGM